MSDTELSSSYLDRFAGVSRLYGLEGLLRLHKSHVCVLGIGGVGSWCVEALVRSGVNRITLIDLDDICVTNTNRQLHTHIGNIGTFKVEAMAQRARLINPEVQIHAHPLFFTSKTAAQLLDPTLNGHPSFDVVIDAIDQTEHKALLISSCWHKKIPIVVSGAAGGRCDPTKVTSADLSQTSHDGLLRNIKRILRSQYELPRQGHWGITAVYSTERPVYPNADGGICDTPPTQESFRLNCQSGFGAVTHLTATFGFVATHHAIQRITQSPIP